MDLVVLVVLVVLDGMVEVVVLDRLLLTQMVVEEVVEVHIFILALRVVQQHRLVELMQQITLVHTMFLVGQKVEYILDQQCQASLQVCGVHLVLLPS